MATRWGILSAGNISSDFVSAMKALPKDEHRLVAVAARSLSDATDFSVTHGVERAYGSYEDLAHDPDVEVVYIGTIHPYHLQTASLMLENGKSVLCEKPLCMNVAETKQLVNLAKKKKLFLMEAIWSRCSPIYESLRRRMNAGEIGDVVFAHSTFGDNLVHVDRFVKRDIGGSSLLDIGVYTVQFASLVMGGEKPLKILAAGHVNDENVDETVSATLLYPNGRTAVVCCSGKCKLPNEAYVVGTKGTLKINSPMWTPESLETPLGTETINLPVTGEKFNFMNSQGLMYEAAEVRRCLKLGLLESPLLPLDETVLISEINEEILKQVGFYAV